MQAVTIDAPADDDTLLTSGQTRARIGNVSTMCVWRWMMTRAFNFRRRQKSTPATIGVWATCGVGTPSA